MNELALKGIVIIIVVTTALAIFMDELGSLTYAPCAFSLNITKLNVTSNDTNQTGSIAGRARRMSGLLRFNVRYVKIDHKRGGVHSEKVAGFF